MSPSITKHRTATREEWLKELDRAPLGRNEGEVSWFRRHDKYEASYR